MLTYRVVQWATGNIGTRALREVIRHPAMDLVGVYVYDPAKVDVDAGVLCGEAPIGVSATSDKETIYALGADCVLYMPRRFDIHDVVSFLAAGTNVVTTCGEFVDVNHRLSDEDRARLLAACERGQSSIYATGSSPGFITDALPFSLLSLQRRVESLEIEEFANLSQRNSPVLLFDLMGFGKPLASFEPARAQHLLVEFGPALARLADAAGLEIDRWNCLAHVAAARHDTAIAAGELVEGSIAAQRTIIAGSRGSHDVVRFTTNWYCATDVDPAWDLQATGWRIRVRGDAPLDVDLTFPIPVAELGEWTPAYTANRPVNAIPYVCAARPGTVTTLDLVPIVPSAENHERMTT